MIIYIHALFIANADKNKMCWMIDQVDEQEAVDVVLREKNLKESCKKLVDMSCTRGNVDDITVMLVNLHNHKFLATS